MQGDIKMNEPMEKLITMLFGTALALLSDSDINSPEYKLGLDMLMSIRIWKKAQKDKNTVPNASTEEDKDLKGLNSK